MITIRPCTIFYLAGFRTAWGPILLSPFPYTLHFTALYVVLQLHKQEFSNIVPIACSSIVPVLASGFCPISEDFFGFVESLQGKKYRNAIH